VYPGGLAVADRPASKRALSVLQFSCPAIAMLLSIKRWNSARSTVADCQALVRTLEFHLLNTH